MVIFYKKWKKYNEKIQLTKCKMDLNIRKITNHLPSPRSSGGNDVLLYPFYIGSRAQHNKAKLMHGHEGLNSFIYRLIVIYNSCKHRYFSQNPLSLVPNDLEMSAFATFVIAIKMNEFFVAI